MKLPFGLIVFGSPPPLNNPPPQTYTPHTHTQNTQALARRNLRPWWMEYSDLLLLGAAGAGLLGAFAWLKATAPGRGGGGGGGIGRR